MLDSCRLARFTTQNGKLSRTATTESEVWQQDRAISATTTKAGATATIAVATTTIAAINGVSLAAVGEEMLAQAKAETRKKLYNSLESENSTTQVTATIPGAVLSVQRLSLAQLQESGASRWGMVIGGTNVSISLPVAFMLQFGDDIVVTAIDIQTPLAKAQFDSTGKQVQVQGIVSLELSRWSRPGEALHVSGLREPIFINLGISASRGVQCGYFDLARQVWSTDGLAPAQGNGSGPPDVSLVCASSHLTLFGGIVEGFAATFVCSQASLMSARGISKITETNWHRQIGRAHV